MTLYPKLILDALATVRYPGTGKNLVEAYKINAFLAFFVHFDSIWRFAKSENTCFGYFVWSFAEKGTQFAPSSAFSDPVMACKPDCHLLLGCPQPESILINNR